MLWSRCRTHQALAEALLAKGDQKILEDSNVDYLWGCGRDRRGHNRYDKALTMFSAFSGGKRCPTRALSERQRGIHHKKHRETAPHHRSKPA